MILLETISHSMHLGGFLAMLALSAVIFLALYFKVNFHQRFPKAFVTLLGVTFLFFGTVASYKYIEKKAQSQSNSIFGIEGGGDIAKFVELNRSSGKYYSSGDLIIGSDQKFRIKKGAIDSNKIENKSIESKDLSSGAVNSRTIKDGSIKGLDIDSQTDLNIKSILLGTNSISGGNFIGDWSFENGGLTVDGNIDMANNMILNVGNNGTDFTNNGGLNLAGNLSVNSDNLFVNTENGRVGIGTNDPNEKLTINGKLAIAEDDSTPSHYTIFEGGNQDENITYTLPEESANGMLVNKDGKLEWDEDDYNRSHAGIDFKYSIASNPAPNQGTLNVSANSATFYTDNNRDDFVHIDLAAVPVMHLTDDVTNFIVACRDLRTFVAITDQDLIDYIHYVPYAEVFKRSGSNAIHTQISPLMGNGEIESHHDRVSRTDRYAREDGLNGLSVNDLLEITIPGGHVWAVNNRYEIEASTTASRGFRNYHDVDGNWAVASSLNPKITNTQYDKYDVDNGHAMTDMTDGYYVINYVYRGVENEDHVYVVYSDQEYESLELAKAAGTIGELPELIRAHAMLIGRVIAQKYQTNDFLTESAFDERFAGNTPVTSHHSLTGQSHDDHLQYALLAGRSGGQMMIGGSAPEDAIKLQGTSGDGILTSPAIQALVGNNGDNTALTILNNGNIGIGTTDPQYGLDIKGSTDGIIARFQGSAAVTGCAIADDGTISCSSDKNLKKNIDEISYGLKAIMDLQPVEYNWKTENDSKSKSLGFIAQDVEEIIPKLVSEDSNGVKQLNTIGLVPIVVKALQEQQVEIEELQKKVGIDIIKDGEEKSGSETIADGKESVEVKTKAISKDSKIFTTFEDNPGTYNWVEKEKNSDGDYTGFKIFLGDKAKKDIKVNWWITN